MVDWSVEERHLKTGQVEAVSVRIDGLVIDLLAADCSFRHDKKVVEEKNVSLVRSC